MTNDTELLLSRVIDGEATAGEWSALVAAATAQPGLWQDIAEAQREHVVLRRFIDEQTDRATRVDVPQPRHGAVDPRGVALRAPRMAWTGWGVAALIGLAVAVQSFLSGTSVNRGPALTGATNEASVLPVRTTDQALQDYIELGQESGDVIAELPAKVLIETRRSPTGEGYELLYLRQILERTHVPDLYEFEGQSEAGQPTLTPLNQGPGQIL